MDEKTAQQLLALNRDFYTTFAPHFAASRTVSDPALTCILPYIPQCASILDAGCGNGRLASLLDRERPGARYVGVDAVPALIELARARAADLVHVPAEFRVADLTRPGWSAGLPGAPYQRVVFLAVLHHLPGFDRRLQVLRELAGLLAPDGRLILSTWQFMVSPRLRRKIVDWSAVEIDPRVLEPGDYLLDWKRGGRGLRYCHFADEDELARLAAGAGLTLRETFRAGGREGNLSLFGILARGRSVGRQG